MEGGRRAGEDEHVKRRGGGAGRGRKRAGSFRSRARSDPAQLASICNGRTMGATPPELDSETLCEKE